jgi:hypothetical protein
MTMCFDKTLKGKIQRSDYRPSWSLPQTMEKETVILKSFQDLPKNKQILKHLA